MRKSIIRRLQALEKTPRCLEADGLSHLQWALLYTWMVTFAYYLGGLQIENDDPFEGYARALGYSSVHEQDQTLEPRRASVSSAVARDLPAFCPKALADYNKRHIDAYRRLFAAYELDFEQESLSVLFEIKAVNNLPDQWSSWLRSNLNAYWRDVKIAAGSNLPSQLSCDNFLLKA